MKKIVFLILLTLILSGCGPSNRFYTCSGKLIITYSENSNKVQTTSEETEPFVVRYMFAGNIWQNIFETHPRIFFELSNKYWFTQKVSHNQENGSWINSPSIYSINSNIITTDENYMGRYHEKEVSTVGNLYWDKLEVFLLNRITGIYEYKSTVNTNDSKWNEYREKTFNGKCVLVKQKKFE